MPGSTSGPGNTAVKDARHDADLVGLDALELALEPEISRYRRIWTNLWPQLAAVVIALGAWQVVVLAGFKPRYVLPGPGTVFAELWAEVRTGEFWHAIAITGQRALTGFLLAVVVGAVIGMAVSRFRPLRTAIGSLITGLQTMPSIAWFPLAILLFKLTPAAIMFVVIIGAAPSIANGLITGVDYVPPLLLRSGRMLGATGFKLYRYIILPASLPSFLAGLKQGWAFAWRSLMAGELLVIIANQPSIGANLTNARELNDAPRLMATMIVILVIGIVVDQLFNVVNGRLRRRWGVVEAGS